LKTTN